MLYVNHILRYKMNRNLRNSLWGKILRLKPKYYDRVSSSSLISRITVDTDSINEFMLDIVLEFFVQTYYLLLTIYEMNKISVNVGFMLLGFLPISFVVTMIIGKINMKFESRMKLKLSDLTSYLSELVSCLPLLKAMNQQKTEEKRGADIIQKYYTANRNVIWLGAASSSIGALVAILPEVVIFVLGIRFLNNGTFDAAGWYTFYLYAGTFIGFCNTLCKMWETTKSVQGRLEKVSDIMYEEEDSLDTYVNELVESGDICFDHVSFGYDTTMVIEDASFTLYKNKINAIVGYSGSGKTTLLKLLERIYEPDQGRILMGGNEISTYSLRKWKNHLAYVSQNTPLMSGSIRENMLYGIRREVTDEELMQVVKKVHLDEFITEHPDGFSRNVGSLGQKLSGGQKQKISVARALLSDADILIMDEPTASLDITSTREIMHTIQNMEPKKTVILVAHDGKLVTAADHLILIDEKRQITEGSNKELYSYCEFYKKLVEGADTDEAE